jgi:hypothetical protein
VIPQYRVRLVDQLLIVQCLLAQPVVLGEAVGVPDLSQVPKRCFDLIESGAGVEPQQPVGRARIDGHGSVEISQESGREALKMPVGG